MLHNQIKSDNQKAVTKSQINTILNQIHELKERVDETPDLIQSMQKTILELKNPIKEEVKFEMIQHAPIRMKIKQ